MKITATIKAQSCARRVAGELETPARGWRTVCNAAGPRAVGARDSGRRRTGQIVTPQGVAGIVDCHAAGPRAVGARDSGRRRTGQIVTPHGVVGIVDCHAAGPRAVGARDSGRRRTGQIVTPYGTPCSWLCGYCVACVVNLSPNTASDSQMTRK